MKNLNLTSMTLTAVLAFTSAASSAFAASADVQAQVTKIDAALKTCLESDDGGSTYGMNTCLDAAETSADALLNRLYTGIVTNLRKPADDEYSRRDAAETLKRLVASQRIWISFREANTSLHGVEMLGGSGEGPAMGTAMYDITKQRVLELNELLGS